MSGDSNFISGQSYEPLRRLVSNKKIEELISKIKVRYDKDQIDWNEKVYKVSDLGNSEWEPQMIIAIDGDYFKSKIENGFPGAEVGYITISSVLLLMDRINDLENEQFIDPRKYRETEQVSSMESLFYGCNVVLEGETSAKSSTRKAIYDDFNKRFIFKNTETLLDTYEALLKIRRENQSSVRTPLCPHDNCDQELEEGYGEYNCSHCGGKLYSTDALRLHELMNPQGTNGEMYSQIKEAIKKIHLIHILRSFEIKYNSLITLRDIVFFIEGSLSVPGTASWLARSFRKELQRINKKLRSECEQDLLILGIEKTGNFVNHFAEIDTKKNGVSDNFPVECVFLPTNDYIKENIIINDDPEYIYLKDIAFGRKFFYKTKAGYRVVPSIATFDNYQNSVKTAFPAQFPRIVDCLLILDKLVSSRYGNSVMPLATAHAEAAIPLNIGNRIFDDIARNIRSNSTNI